MTYKISDIHRAVKSGECVGEIKKGVWVVARWEQYASKRRLLKDTWGVFRGKYHAVDWGE